MPTKPVTLNLPEELYARATRLAEQAQRSVEAEIVEAVAKGLAPEDKLSTDYEQVLASLELLDDNALWRAAYSHLSKKASAKIEKLHHKRSSEGLTPDESAALKALLDQYEYFMLVRAKAAAMLKERGYDISGLLKKP